MNEFEPLILLLVFGPIVWWVWWMNKDQPQPKLDFGLDKPKKMRSWEGAIYALWNWKTYAAKTLWLVGVPIVWYQSDIGSAILWFMIGLALVLMGRFWELFKK